MNLTFPLFLFLGCIEDQSSPQRTPNGQHTNPQAELVKIHAFDPELRLYDLFRQV